MESLGGDLTTGSGECIIGGVKPVCNGIPIVGARVEDPLFA